MLAQFAERNIHLKLSDDGKILATGDLTDADRETIRRNREYLILELGGPTMTPEKTRLACEIEGEVSACLAGPDFAAWSGDCRRGWARSIIGIIEGEGLVINGGCRGILDDIARRGV